MVNNFSIDDSFTNLKSYVERADFAGYDPYDTLNSPIPFRRLGKWPPVLAIQFQKRNPINIRPLLGIRKARNPKAIGLFLLAYALLYRHDPRPEYLRTMQELLHWLEENTSRGYSGACWGYNFPWASPVKYLEAWTPSAVATGFVAKGLYEYYQVTRDEGAAGLLRGAAQFVLHDLPRHEDDSGMVFSYTPVMKDACYNASLLAAEILARADAVSGTSEHMELALNAMRHVLSRQKPDGHWKYSEDPATGAERSQTDFHQGYVLESLYDLQKLTGAEIDGFEDALARGLAFYRREQFFDDGRSKWRLPKTWPVEIHNQAQGIVTFRRLAKFGRDDEDFAHRIAAWTVENMQDERGYFYYQKHQRYMIKIPYMRWSNAWMFLALAGLRSSG